MAAQYQMQKVQKELKDIFKIRRLMSGLYLQTFRAALSKTGPSNLKLYGWQPQL